MPLHSTEGSWGADEVKKRFQELVAMDHGSLTIRVSRSTHGLLRELADCTGETMTDIVDHAVRAYQRQRFWADYHAAYELVKADPTAWADLQQEAESWDSTLADGLEEHVHVIDERGPG